MLKINMLPNQIVGDGAAGAHYCIWKHNNFQHLVLPANNDTSPKPTTSIPLTTLYLTSFGSDITLIKLLFQCNEFINVYKQDPKPASLIETFYAFRLFMKCNNQIYNGELLFSRF